MKHLVLNFAAIMFFLGLVPFNTNAQDTPNLDFNQGFNGWKGKVGHYKDVTNSIPIKLDSIRCIWEKELNTPSEIEQEKTIINPSSSTSLRGNANDPTPYAAQRRFVHLTRDILVETGTLMDPNAPQLPKIPEGANSVVRIGNPYSGAECEELFYDFKVDTNNDFLVLKYAMVMETPDHPIEQNPFFEINIKIKEGNEYVEHPDFKCGHFKAYSSNSLIELDTAFHYVNNKILNSLLYRSWHSVGMDLSSMQGKDIRVEITSSDCQPNGHFAYCYFTGGLGKMEVLAVKDKFVDTNQVAYMEAPEGFLYEWYKSNKVGDIIGQILSTAQRLLAKSTYFNENKDSLHFICKLHPIAEPNLCERHLTVFVKKPHFNFNIKEILINGIAALLKGEKYIGVAKVGDTVEIKVATIPGFIVKINGMEQNPYRYIPQVKANSKAPNSYTLATDNSQDEILIELIAPNGDAESYNLIFDISPKDASPEDPPMDISQIASNDISVKMYPNPLKRNQLFTLETNIPNAESNAVISIFDIQGKKIFTKPITEKSIQLTAPSAAGVYIIRVQYSNEYKDIKITVK